MYKFSDRREMINLMSRKFHVGDILSIEAAKTIYSDYGLDVVCTDGKFVQLEKEGDSYESNL